MRTTRGANQIIIFAVLVHRGGAVSNEDCGRLLTASAFRLFYLL